MRTVPEATCTMELPNAEQRDHWACLRYREGNLRQQEGQGGLGDCSLGHWYSAWLGMDEEGRMVTGLGGSCSGGLHRRTEYS